MNPQRCSQTPPLICQISEGDFSITYNITLNPCSAVQSAPSSLQKQIRIYRSCIPEHPDPAESDSENTGLSEAGKFFRAPFQNLHPLRWQISGL